MKINKIVLENYRVHKKREFEFSKGINLVLGRNGAGKSSILEAIGVVLFGADARTSDKDAVMLGEKSAYINVEITGNDGIEYIVEKKFGASNDYRLYPKGTKLPLIQGKESILAKIREISGIEKNSKEIYQNVVTAYQNKIVGIFSDTPKNREVLFNKIFDTAIYREMESGYLKSAKDDYELQKKLLSREIEQRREGIEDIEFLKSELIKNEEIYQQINYDYIKKKDEIAVIEEEKEKLLASKNRIELLKKEAAGDEKLIAENIALAEKQNTEYEKAEAAVKICREAVSDYNLYIELEKKEKELKEIVAKKEDIKNKLEIAKNKKQESEKEVEKYKTIISEREKSEIELNNKTGEMNLKKSSITEENSKELGNKREKDLKKSEIEKKISDLKESIIKIEDIEKELNRIESEKKFLIEKQDKLKETKDEYKEINGKIELYQKNREEKRAIEKKLETLKIRRVELKEAENKLSGGVCPYLHEKCKNIGEESGFSIYFKNREAELTDEIDRENKNLEQYKNSEEELQKILSHEAVLQKELSDIEISSEKIKRAEAEKELYLLKKSEIMNVLSKKFKDVNSKEQVNELLDLIENERAEIRAEVERIQAVINENSKKQFEIDIELRELKIKFEKNDEEKRKYCEELSKAQEIILKADGYIELKSGEIEGLEEDKKKLTILAGEKERSSQNYKIYMSNIKLAEEVGNIKASLEKTRVKIDELKSKMEEISAEIDREGENFQQEILDEKIKLILKLREEYEQLSKANSSKEMDIKQLKERTDKSKKESELLIQKESELLVISRKIELTDMFRKNIGSMGRAVSAELISMVEREATENFRRITGRDEEINWINGEKEIYSVYLSSKTGIKRMFEILSGGEQVAVALSIRAAMASTLTTAGFAIFDEPTINLDIERKRYLSESLQEILRGLEQAIIVTHDDTFEEMAEKIIEV